RIIGFDHRKSVLSNIPSANECTENIMINVNHEKSSSRAVYEYFTNKHEDVKSSDGVWSLFLSISRTEIFAGGACLALSPLTLD
ncbi:hypothetical protein L195_g057069, partial [Trifolium pratense]